MPVANGFLFQFFPFVFYFYRSLVCVLPLSCPFDTHESIN
jgi:hypothetical protein